MGNRSREENGRAVVETASPVKIAGNSESVDFEKLLSDLSAAFIRVSAEGVDAEVERWLQLVVLAMNIDRSTVVQVDPADGLIYVTHQWARAGLYTPRGGVIGRSRANLVQRGSVG